MADWEYVCRYCDKQLGLLAGNSFSDEQLGLNQLTPEERADIITENTVSDRRQVRVVCEDCQQTLERDPELSLSPYLFH